VRVSYDTYSKAYPHVAFRREDGILELRLHTDDGSLVWGEPVHEELGPCFADVGSDPDNRVVIVTGTGAKFCGALDGTLAGPLTPQRWRTLYADGIRMLTNLLAIEVPVIGVVNGPASVHAELAVMHDIVIAADTAYLRDGVHFRMGAVPGDGVHVVWPMILGPTRGSYFLLTGQRLTAQEAQSLGVVNEVVPADTALDRAWELARELAMQPDATLRYARAAITDSRRRLLAEQLPLGLALEGLSAVEFWPS
jgi:enoyl-CoA hydratase/carnithine racemase